MVDRLPLFIPRATLALLVLNLGSCSPQQQTLSPPIPPIATPHPAPQYHPKNDPRGTIHLLRIPPGYRLSIAVAPRVSTLDQFTQNSSTIAAINGGYFNPTNQQTTSVIRQNGSLTGDPKANPNLTSNPSLTPYLPRIFDRSELRRYDCAGQPRYTIDRHSAPIPQSCQLMDALGAGPQLLPRIAAIEEAFYAEDQGVILRDPIGIHRPNARSAIGLLPDGSLLLVMVAQGASPQAQGMTLAEVADLLRQEGATQALNLDGGGSSSFWFDGKTHLGKLDDQGRSVQRPVKSILLVEAP